VVIIPTSILITTHIYSCFTGVLLYMLTVWCQVRVSTWRQRIDPVLKEEEDRSAFDIHDYGGRILQRLETLTLDPLAAAAAEKRMRDLQQQQEEEEQQVEGRQQRGKKGSKAVAQEAGAAAGGPAFVLKEVVQCGDSFDVCRMFAAVLQLINNRWVAFIS
jgi:hypothetical protein